MYIIMSDYKLVNGKKVRVCKYGCDTELVWSDDISGFIETKGGVAHTQERCKEVKQQKKIPNFTVGSLLEKLESLGITLDLDKVMKA